MTLCVHYLFQHARPFIRLCNDKVRTLTNGKEVIGVSDHCNQHWTVNCMHGSQELVVLAANAGRIADLLSGEGGTTNAKIRKRTRCNGSKAHLEMDKGMTVIHLKKRGP